MGEIIGKGSSRQVFDNGAQVIKQAITKRRSKGHEQNRAEYQIFDWAAEHVRILCPIRNISPDYRELTMDKAIALRDRNFKNIPEDIIPKVREFKKKLRLIVNHPDIRCHFWSKSQRSYGVPKPEKTKEARAAYRSRLFQDIMLLVREYQLVPGDLERLSSWGYYKGRFVLIDYGCTKSVYDEYYDRSNRR